MNFSRDRFGNCEKQSAAAIVAGARDRWGSAARKSQIARSVI